MVNNSLKYAEAKNISLLFNILPGEISFTYSDDGKGFDFEEKLKSKSIGLTGIISRVNFLSGSLEVESKPDEGVSFFITIPA
jgi:signal transduction histidine kinase